MAAKLKTLPYTWFYKSQEVTRRGIPDYILCVGGRFVALELKKDDKEDADELQKYNLKKIHDSGGVSFVTTPDNWQFVFETLEGLSKGVRDDQDEG